MKFEHKKQKVADVNVFVKRVFRYMLFAFFLIAFSVGMGTLGYKYYGATTWVDAFHMACMILTGMGPVIPLETDSAKLFSSFYALYSGVAFLSSTAVFFSPIIHRLLHMLQVDDQTE
jgi:hypothetical protein